MARLRPLLRIIALVLSALARECPRLPASYAGILRFRNRSSAAAVGGLLLRWLFRDCRDWGDPTRTVGRDYLPVRLASQRSGPSPWGCSRPPPSGESPSGRPGSRRSGRT